MDAPTESPGLSATGASQPAGAAIVGLLGTRLELLGIELREEALYLQRMLVMGIVAAFFLGAALVLAAMLVAAAFWDSHRLLALASVAALFAIAGTIGLMRLRSSVVERSPPFQATVRELQADLQALRDPAP